MPDLADKAIEYIRQQKSLTPDKPFFVYFAPGATHTPHHVPQEWIERWKGKFDQGWDALREETFARQKELGVVPADADLTARSEGITAWDDVDDAMKPILARQMEVYAGFLEYADHHIGRVIDALEELGILEDTLVYYIIGDNGASAEGGPHGTFMITTTSNGGRGVRDRRVLERAPRPARRAARLQPLRLRLGARDVHAVPVDQAGGVALRRHSQRHDRALAGEIEASGETRHQWHHVIDVAPTILELAGIEEPHTVNGVTQIPMQGVSMAYCFDDAEADERHHDPVLRADGQPRDLPRRVTAVTQHRSPLDLTATAHGVLRDNWELVRHEHRLDAVARPVGRAAGEAGRAAAALG